MLILNSRQDSAGNYLRRETIDLEAGTYTLEENGEQVESRALTPEEIERYSPPPPTPEELESRALRAAARLSVTDRLLSDALDQATIEAVAAIYDPWEPGLSVAVGDVLRWDGTLVEVLQAHTTQADWEPPDVPALFRVYRTDTGGGPIEWIAGIAVTAGEQVIYQGTTYNVLQSHTTQVGWEPPAVPSLFEPLP